MNFTKNLSIHYIMSDMLVCTVVIMSDMLVCTVVIIVAKATLLSGFLSYGIMIIGLYVSVILLPW
jgi:hypothetical protein